MVNTVLGGASGGLTVLFSIKFLFGKKWSYLMTLNGALTGMVSMCAGCNVFQPWAALIVGALGGAAFIAVHELMLKLRLVVLSIICTTYFLNIFEIFSKAKTFLPRVDQCKCL